MHFCFNFLKKQYSAYEWSRYIYATPLLKSELENTKFKKKIRSIIRNPPQHDEEKVDNLSMCCICCTSSTEHHHLIPEMSLECPTTKDAIPMCICTGKHMVVDDWCFCPISGFPALFSEYIKLIKASISDDEAGVVQAKDPIFGHEISLESLKQVSIIMISFLCYYYLHIRISL